MKYDQKGKKKKKKDNSIEPIEIGKSTDELPSVKKNKEEKVERIRVTKGDCVK